MGTDIFLVILGMAAVTFLTRIGSQILFRKMRVSSSLERWLKYVPIAMLTTLIVPSILLPKGDLELNLHNDYLLAGIVAGIVAYKSGNAALTMVFGLLTVMMLRWMG